VILRIKLFLVICKFAILYVMMGALNELVLFTMLWMEEISWDSELFGKYWRQRSEEKCWTLISKIKAKTKQVTSHVFMCFQVDHWFSACFICLY